MSSPNHRRRVVVTGIGVITAVGSDVDTFWGALVAGSSGVRRITQFDPVAAGLPCLIAGEIPDFDPTDYFSAKQARRMSRNAQITYAAALKGLSDADLKTPLSDLDRIGVYFGTAIGGFEKAEEGIETMRKHGATRINPFNVPAALPNMSAFYVTQHLGALGPSSTITTACAAGTQTVGEAAEVIRYGRADMMLAVAAEALIRDYTIGGFSSMRALPTSFNEEPHRASRPFDAKREGFVFSEGAACLVLEEASHAQARGAHIYAEIAGHASSSDGFHVAAPNPSADGAIRTMALALNDAHITPEEVSYINAHGTSTPANDEVESLAIKKLFGERAYEIPVSSTKSMLGHPMGASGAIEAAVCALTIDRRTIHPTVNYEFPDPACDLDYVPNKARQVGVEIALSNSFGLGGQNSCLVLRRFS